MCFQELKLQKDNYRGEIEDIVTEELLVLVIDVLGILEVDTALLFTGDVKVLVTTEVDVRAMDILRVRRMLPRMGELGELDSSWMEMSSLLSNAL